jgi:outer membrane lipoprotein SlyB
VVRLTRTVAACVVPVLLAGCGPDYSPDTYDAAAVQQANKVERGVVIGVRQIDVTAAGVVGTATGAAAGGVAGAQTPGGGVAAAFGAIGGGLVGGLLGNSVEHATGDTQAFEYIVREANNDLVSVTQKDAAPLKIGTKVLVIGGKQARIVPDYTVNPEAGAPTAPAGSPPTASATAASPAATGPAPTASTAPSPPAVAVSPLPAPAAPPSPVPAADAAAGSATSPTPGAEAPAPQPTPANQPAAATAQ